jgi:hypothetical protein
VLAFRATKLIVTLNILSMSNAVLCYTLKCVSVHSGDQVKKTEMGRTCGTYGGEERCIQGFSGET